MKDRVTQVNVYLVRSLSGSLNYAEMSGRNVEWPYYWGSCGSSAIGIWDRRTGILQEMDCGGQSINERCTMLNECYWCCAASQNEHVVEGQI